MGLRGLAALAAALCIGPALAGELPLDGSVDATTLATRFLASVYGDYDKQRGCWMVTAEEQDFELQYCMKLDRADLVGSNSGRRLYILAAGELADPLSGGHSSAGLAGAFVLEDHQGRTETIAAKDCIPVGGSFGAAPRQWQFIRLGPSDYWGWLSSGGYTQQGVTESRYVVLAPYGKSVRDLARQGLRAGLDDSGMDCPESAKGCGGSAWTSTVAADSGGADSVWPLLLTVSGSSHGKAVNKTFSVPFDRRSWSYQKPDDPLFKGP